MIVAIDGPAGSGKSTVARMVARRLKFRYIETGSMYRAVAWKANQVGIDPTDGEEGADEVAEVARNLNIEFKPADDGSQRVFVEGRELTRELKNETVGRMAAVVAANPEVREILVSKQREMGRNHDVVMDGRDIGTVVFPDAQKKFYLDADPVERARRRYDEMKGTDPDLDFDQIVEQVRQRDHEDKTRAASPLRRAEDAMLIDTTSRSIDEVVEQMVRAIESAPEELKSKS
ncbi:Cytidylate kinase [Nitrospina gracilis 3/211]|uniref:Cytidylate kinase n=1 Tax=Nitrospina gracilis (strain 3/211) TaxID=1266370 RepID=M1YH89_NITG3|nr:MULTISPECIES: (d)CMP kinase [Nitrospina]MCF8722867.1 cytidylate kinase [Nitrospina sp. Nb-3]CCQ89829.1 Cytidylate kinase [Nitrospina gracilis 3/211]